MIVFNQRYEHIFILCLVVSCKWNRTTQLRALLTSLPSSPKPRRIFLKTTKSTKYRSNITWNKTISTSRLSVSWDVLVEKFWGRTEMARWYTRTTATIVNNGGWAFALCAAMPTTALPSFVPIIPRFDHYPYSLVSHANFSLSLWLSRIVHSSTMIWTSFCNVRFQINPLSENLKVPCNAVELWWPCIDLQSTLSSWALSHTQGDRIRWQRI